MPPLRAFEITVESGRISPTGIFDGDAEKLYYGTPKFTRSSCVFVCQLPERKISTDVDRFL